MGTLILTEAPKKMVIEKAIPKSEAQIKLTQLISEWCECENPDFLCYPEDDKCTCGIYKHHVHCVCGAVLQIG